MGIILLFLYFNILFFSKVARMQYTPREATIIPRAQQYNATA
ncbi:MAG: hypothetical protein SNG60_00665 [Rikenellaceae bacterium]